MIRLSFSGLQSGWQRAEIQLQDNPVTFDNQFYFTFNVKQQMPVLLIDGGTANPFLKAVFDTDPFFAAKRTDDGNVDYAGLRYLPADCFKRYKTHFNRTGAAVKNLCRKRRYTGCFSSADADLANYKAFSAIR